VLDGSWTSTDTWSSMADGEVVISPYSAAVTPEAAAAADAVQAATIAGMYNVFTGPIYDQDGNMKVAEGVVMTDAELAVMDWYVKGVESAS
jgi:basic membrane protein A